MNVNNNNNIIYCDQSVVCVKDRPNSTQTIYFLLSYYTVAQLGRFDLFSPYNYKSNRTV